MSFSRVYPGLSHPTSVILCPKLFCHCQTQSSETKCKCLDLVHKYKQYLRLKQHLHHHSEIYHSYRGMHQLVLPRRNSYTEFRRTSSKNSRMFKLFGGRMGMVSHVLITTPRRLMQNAEFDTCASQGYLSRSFPKKKANSNIKLLSLL